MDDIILLFYFFYFMDSSLKSDMYLDLSIKNSNLYKLGFTVTLPKCFSTFQLRVISCVMVMVSIFLEFEPVSYLPNS